MQVSSDETKSIEAKWLRTNGNHYLRPHFDGRKHAQTIALVVVFSPTLTLVEGFLLFLIVVSLMVFA